MIKHHWHHWFHSVNRISEHPVYAKSGGGRHGSSSDVIGIENVKDIFSGSDQIIRDYPPMTLPP
jgi:hypothetical protein